MNEDLKQVAQILAGTVCGIVAAFWIGAAGFEFLVVKNVWWQMAMSMTVVYVSATLGIVCGIVAYLLVGRVTA